MSLIMEAWRERGYAPPGSERMLQDYEDKLELERNKQDLIYALKYPPAPPPPPPPSPEDTRNEIYARLYPPSNGPAPPPELEDLSDGTLGVAGDVHAIRKVLDASGVEHYLPFRHNSIVIGLPDVAKARNALAGVRWGGDAEAKADEDGGFGAGPVGFGTVGFGASGRTERAGDNQGWAARPAMGAAAYEPPNALPSQVAQATRPAWADHIAGIDTPTLEGILAQRYVMQLRGGEARGPSANSRADTLLQPSLLQGSVQAGTTPADPHTPVVQNLSSNVADAGGSRGFVNPANASAQGSTAFAGRSTTTDPKAYGQPQLDPREREQQLLRMSDEPTEAHTAAEWAAAAQEYKDLQIRLGRKFSRDSFYNGLWSKGMATGASAGKTPERSDFNGMADLAVEANVHSDFGTAAGGAVGAVLGKNGARFVTGAVVLDKKTGKTFQGTVDLGPTFDRINRSVAHPHSNDGSEFENRQPRGGTRPLPEQVPGHYKEYVVPTPGGTTPGPQRLVIGNDGKVYYTPDHYKTFVPIN